MIKNGSPPQPLKKQDQLFFLHIPKAAGTTLTALLSQQFEEKAICPFYYPLELVNVTPQQLSKYRFVRGHFHYEVIERLLPKKTRFVTLLRNPIDRFLSHFYYWQQNPEVINAHPEFVNQFTETTLEQFVYLTTFPLNLATSNYQTKWLTATIEQWDTVEEWINKFRQYKKKPPLDIELGKQRLARFDIVGLAERFQETLFLLSYRFGWPPLVNTKRLNVNANRPPQRNIAAEILEEIRQLNRLDEQLYAYAEQLFEEHFQHMTHHLLERYGSRSQAHLAYPIPADVLIELLEKHHTHVSHSR